MPRKSMLSVLPCALLVVTLAMLSVPAQDAELITKVQSALKDKGLDPGPIDGLMGPRTSRALRDFQIQNDIQVTGEINKGTLDRLGIKGSFLGRVGSSFKAAGGAVAGAATTGAKATASGATTGAKATAKGATAGGKAVASGATKGAKAATSWLPGKKGGDLADRVEARLKKDLNLTSEDVRVRTEVARTST